MKSSEKSTAICRSMANGDYVMHIWIFRRGGKSTNFQVTKSYPKICMEVALVGSHGNPNGKEIEPIFTASNTCLLNTVFVRGICGAAAVCGSAVVGPEPRS